MKKHYTYLIFALIAFSFTSCKEDTLQDKIARIGANYFSVNQYIFDHWTTYNGSPFTILKTVKENDKIDSFYTNSEKIDWREVINTFFETDISDKELLGHYKFSQFEDKEDGTEDFYYQAIDDDLFTQKLLITADPFTQHIKGIYIETFNHSKIFGDTKQKLFYSPLKTIQIQQFEYPMIGKKKSRVIQYYFIK